MRYAVIMVVAVDVTSAGTRDPREGRTAEEG